MTRGIVYLHGIPGGPDELNLFGALNWPDDVHITAPDRNILSGPLAEALPAGPFILIGFSMGAKAAIELAAFMPDRISHLHLISAAGPVSDDKLLGQMAGGSLFRMARDRPRQFALITRLQSWVAGIAPRFLVRMLLASAKGGDKALALNPAFRTTMALTLKGGLGRTADAYCAEITAYMAPWRDVMAAVRTPVTIWHGEEDNWAPISLADALAASMPGPLTIHRLPGLSHYSTLAHALNRISSG